MVTMTFLFKERATMVRRGGSTLSAVWSSVACPPRHGHERSVPRSFHEDSGLCVYHRLSRIRRQGFGGQRREDERNAARGAPVARRHFAATGPDYGSAGSRPKQRWAWRVSQLTRGARQDVGSARSRDSTCDVHEFWNESYYWNGCD